MAWTIEYLPTTLKQLKQLDPQSRNRIIHYLGDYVSGLEDAHEAGKALTGQWAGCWRYRQGPYRMICILMESKLVVNVVKVGHRSTIYDKAPTADVLTLVESSLQATQKEDKD